MPTRRWGTGSGVPYGNTQEHLTYLGVKSVVLFVVDRWGVAALGE
jgi:hypothetical protein